MNINNTAQSCIFVKAQIFIENSKILKIYEDVQHHRKYLLVSSMYCPKLTWTSGLRRRLSRCRERSMELPDKHFQTKLLDKNVLQSSPPSSLFSSYTFIHKEQKILQKKIHRVILKNVFVFLVINILVFFFHRSVHSEVGVTSNACSVGEKWR